jgi:hypothetical protein
LAAANLAARGAAPFRMASTTGWGILPARDLLSSTSRDFR